MDCCLPLVLIPVTAVGHCRSFMQEGNTPVGLGCSAEGTGGSGNRLFRTSLRGGQVSLRRCEPLAHRGRGRVAPALRLQLVNTHMGSANALPYLFVAALRGLWLVVHISSMPGPGQPSQHGFARLTQATRVTGTNPDW